MKSAAGIPSTLVSSLSSLIDFVRSDLGKLIRYGAVAAISVPAGTLLLWIFLEVFEIQPVVANIMSVSIMAIPNYLMNRYWVWEKKGANSISREVAPFWILALLGALLSTFLVWLADRFTDSSVVFLGANIAGFGTVWVLKFFVLEKYLFGEASHRPAEVSA